MVFRRGTIGEPLSDGVGPRHAFWAVEEKKFIVEGNCARRGLKNLNGALVLCVTGCAIAYGSRGTVPGCCVKRYPRWAIGLREVLAVGPPSNAASIWGFEINQGEEALAHLTYNSLGYSMKELDSSRPSSINDGKRGEDVLPHPLTKIQKRNIRLALKKAPF